MTQLGLIDYGMGNLHSVRRAFERLGADLITVGDQSAQPFRPDSL